MSFKQYLRQEITKGLDETYTEEHWAKSTPGKAYYEVHLSTIEGHEMATPVFREFLGRGGMRSKVVAAEMATGRGSDVPCSRCTSASIASTIADASAMRPRLSSQRRCGIASLRLRNPLRSISAASNDAPGIAASVASASPRLRVGFC